MTTVVLGSALSRWLDSVPVQASSGSADSGQISMQLSPGSLGEVLEQLFARYPRLRGYLLDEHAVVRHHVTLFVNGKVLANKRDLSQPLAADAELYLMQALSGG